MAWLARRARGRGDRSDMGVEVVCVRRGRLGAMWGMTLSGGSHLAVAQGEGVCGASVWVGACA